MKAAIDARYSTDKQREAVDDLLKKYDPKGGGK